MQEDALWRLWPLPAAGAAGSPKQSWPPHRPPCLSKCKCTVQTDAPQHPWPLCLLQERLAHQSRAGHPTALPVSASASARCKQTHRNIPGLFACCRSGWLTKAGLAPYRPSVPARAWCRQTHRNVPGLCLLHELLGQAGQQTAAVSHALGPLPEVEGDAVNDHQPHLQVQHQLCV